MTINERFQIREHFNNLLNVISGQIHFDTVIDLNTDLMYKYCVNAIDELNYSKQDFKNQFQYNSYIDFLIGELENSLSGDININKWLKEYKTTEEEVITWTNEICSEDNLLHKIMETDLVLKANIINDFKAKPEDILEDLFNIEKTKILLIQNHFNHYYRRKYQKSMIDSLKTQKTSIEKEEEFNNDDDQIITNENSHPRIFVSSNSFKLFERLKKTVRQGKELADYSFIYRQMLKDKLIFSDIKDTAYRDWLNDTYDIDIERTKQLHLCSTRIKLDLYNVLKAEYEPY